LLIEKISPKQLFCLIILEQIGSTTLFALGIDAKQDAWIAILIALFVGLGLVWVYTEIIKYYPNQNLAEIFIFVLGKWLAAPLVLLYALFWFMTASFNAYEFAEFVVEDFLPKTTLWALLLTALILVMYSLLLGIESIARCSELILPYFLFFIVAMYFLVFISGDVNLEPLSPVLENGIMPVLSAARGIINFPFGEMVIFFMYWRYVNNKQAIRKFSLLAVGISGILLTISLVTMIAVLGVNLTAISTIPLFKAIRHISIAHFLQRFDAIGGAILFIGGFYKMTLMFNGSRLAVQTLFNIKKPKHQKWLIILMKIILFWYINVYFKNFTFYRWEGQKINVIYLMFYYTVFIPCLLLAIIKVKMKMKGNKKIQDRNIHVEP
jgi:spore germination protein KB